MSAAFFTTLARAAAARYPAGDRYARHFAFGKLTGDPVFRFLLERGVFPPGARILDLGCGQGLLAALLLTARDLHQRGEWPGAWPAAPAPRTIRGIELGMRDVQRARHACGGRADFIQGDIRTAPFGEADAVVILDVLHYLDPAAQRDVLARVRAALAGGGMLLLRVADASGSLRFRYTLAVDRVVTALRGQRFGRLHCRPLAQWREELASLGFRVESLPMSAGTPFANVLLSARYDSSATPSV